MGTIILNKKSFNLTIAQQTQCIKATKTAFIRNR
jgi:hypothetical protein